MEQRHNWGKEIRLLLKLVILTVAFMLPSLSQTADEEWKQAKLPYEWSFPRDLGAHPGYKTEWWYFTGNCDGPSGERFGYQLTFFRSGIRVDPPSPENAWSLRDLYMAHMTITDIERGRFIFEERMSRAGPGLAGAETGRMKVWLLDWSARMAEGEIFLEARKGETAIRLNLKPKKPLVLHGQEGLSRKGQGLGQASFYSSYTDLETAGTIQTSKDRIYTVTGRSWFDHEFSSNIVSANQVGWDWFSLQLSDGRELMLYLLRRQDGSAEPTSSGTLIEADGSWRHLDLSQISVAVLNKWQSPVSGGLYPGRWRIRVPGAGIDLTLAPLAADQELNSSLIPGLVYWEGAVEGQDLTRNQEVTCRGYVELTGYVGSFRGIFE